MITAAYCQTLARYNEWMNIRLYELCSRVPDTERKTDKGLFFGSIHATLNHLLYGDIAWLSRFLGNEDAVPVLGQELYADFRELAQARREWDSKISKWAAITDEVWLAAPFTFTSKVDGVARTKPAWVLVSHMYNHETHHRGQLTAVLSQMGYDYGATDIPFMPE